ncbi:5-oxoprolinase subunit PxpA [Siphonobacter sp. SORGH_AS_0500]|uniref:LamB/YcsF family protein n=1 Tax=Siphonobacter sp. SORGH_AS_0500 TaxID=1864824 RepID=UPI002860D683|nr:5-oxoprolinase subunit PxpA [Siphonobacter sp. SORGH_AS_0500]MDR6197546.1 UPF0271 protein [Siphonobacter sp. SORGH_AS_0500]
MRIDINCDLGESFGAYTIGQDEAILPLITSANVACGFHAGDPGVMRYTVEKCLEHNVAIGAHPGFADLQGFGRRNMQLSPAEVYELVLYQVGALAGFVRAAGTRLQHVKPHGALYNMAAKDAAMARAIAQAVRDFDANLFLYGLAGSYLISEAEQLGLNTCSEIFADRKYQADGTLTPRNQPDAHLTDPAEAVAQVMRLMNDSERKAETVCIHGDGSQALAFAQTLHTHLQQAGVRMLRPD